MTRFGSLRRPGALITVAAAGMLGVGLAAVPASAHTPTWGVDCSTAWVDLQHYGHDGDQGNTVALTVDGKELLGLTHFGDSFTKKDIALPPHPAGDLTVHISVVAVDGKQYSLEDDKTVKACPATEESTPPASASPSAPDSSAPASSAPAVKPSESTSPTAPASSAEVAPASSSPAADNLAETGSSSATPMIAGAAAVVVVAGAAILWASRRRRAAQH